MAEPDKGSERLTLKQLKFVEYYVGEANGNASEAARMAGYAAPVIQGCENLRKPNIRTAIDERLAPLVLSTNEILHRLSEHARVDVGDFEDLITINEVEGEIRMSIDLKAAKRKGVSRLIKKITPNRNGVSIEFHDAQGALDKLARCHGLYKDRLDVNTTEAPPRLNVPETDDRSAQGEQG